MRHLAKGLAFAGLATLLFGISFVRGAIRENEPEAATKGSWVFGGLGLALLSLAALLTRISAARLKSAL